MDKETAKSSVKMSSKVLAQKWLAKTNGAINVYSVVRQKINTTKVVSIIRSVRDVMYVQQRVVRGSMQMVF
jgi:hypothetical protein